MALFSAESVLSRARFIPLCGLVLASIVAFTLTRPSPAPGNHPSYEQYDHYKRVGKCINGRMVYTITRQ